MANKMRSRVATVLYAWLFLHSKAYYNTFGVHWHSNDSNEEFQQC